MWEIRCKEEQCAGLNEEFEHVSTSISMRCHARDQKGLACPSKASAGNNAQNSFQVATLRLANTKLTICAQQYLVASIIPASLQGVHFAS
jgi:hypothetical protein